MFCSPIFFWMNTCQKKQKDIIPIFRDINQLFFIVFLQQEKKLK